MIAKVGELEGTWVEGRMVVFLDSLCATLLDIKQVVDTTDDALEDHLQWCSSCLLTELVRQLSSLLDVPCR